MTGGLLSVLLFGFILGIKHALEPDHIIAVTTIASQSKKLYRSALSGVFWGIGHTATLFIISTMFIVLKSGLSEKWAMSLEFCVGIMLVYLGVTAMYSRNRPHSPRASYKKSLLIGFIHGMAGSAAMVLLTVNTVQTVWQGAFYILIFGIGTVVGMLFFTTCIGISFLITFPKKAVSGILRQATAILSMVYGLYYIYHIGISEGLFQL